MNKVRKVIIAYCIAVAIACTFVPLKMGVKQGVFIGHGYRPIWLLRRNQLLLSVDFERVILQLIAITAIAAIAFVLVWKPSGRSETK